MTLNSITSRLRPQVHPSSVAPVAVCCVMYDLVESYSELPATAHCLTSMLLWTLPWTLNTGHAPTLLTPKRLRIGMT